MSDRIGSHLRSNLIGYIALFCFAMSGTASALDGSNTVFTDDIVNGEVKAADIGTGELTSGDILNGTIDRQDLSNGAVGGTNILAGAVSSPKVENNSLTNLDIDNTSSLGPAEIGELGTAEIAEGSVTGADLAGTGIGTNGFNGDEEILDGTITGFDIAGSTITGNNVSDSTLGADDLATDSVGSDEVTDGSLSAGDTSDVFDAGYGGDLLCHDDDEDGEVCAAATFDLNEPGKLLVNATGEWWVASVEGDPGADMACRLQVDGVDIGLQQSFGALDAGDSHPFPQNGTMALTALSGVLSAGSHTAQTFCTQFNADIDMGSNQITAARVAD
jgi:hypothetical protein